MLLCSIDEASPEPNTQNHPESRFLVMGVTMVDTSKCKELNDGIESIRAEYGFQHNDALKFALHDKPDHVSNEQHANAKAAVISLAAALKVKVIVYCALHRIIDSQGQDRYLDMGIESCFTKIQQFYSENEKENGWFCLIDRHSRATLMPLMKSKFLERNHQAYDGFKTPDLIGVSMTWDGTTHLSSLCDIVTGSFNYIVNNPSRDQAGKKLIRLLKPLVWGQPSEDGKLTVTERGLLFRPKSPNVTLQHHFTETKSRILDWANQPD